MAVERAAGGTSLIDVLDRVLDKGIVIDAWVRLSLVGIDLLTVEARVVVASIDTYLKFSEAVGATTMVARPSSLAAAAPSTAGPIGAQKAKSQPKQQEPPPQPDPQPLLIDVPVGTAGRAPRRRARPLPN